jgi:hypothetical protein
VGTREAASRRVCVCVGVCRGEIAWVKIKQWVLIRKGDFVGSVPLLYEERTLLRIEGGEKTSWAFCCGQYWSVHFLGL